MIDIHSHLLPGIDDGAVDIEMSVKMAQMAYADGIRGMICTPHIMPSVYDNSASSIARALKRLMSELEQRDVGLVLFAGADVHIAPDLRRQLESGRIPTLARSRYFLFEPSHHILTPKIEQLAADLMDGGFTPIITHPERLTWVPNHYDVIERLNQCGCLMQVTAGSITGDFGRNAQYYAERMLDEGRVDIIATDAHDPVRRPPVLSRARDAVVRRLGEDEAVAMVATRPLNILLNLPLSPIGSGRAAPADTAPAWGASDDRNPLIEKLMKAAER